MTPALYIALGLVFIAGGGFVVFQGLRARKMRAGPWPTFFVVAFAIHLLMALLGIFLIAKGLLSMGAA